jgi:hypothetical protein
MKKLIVMMAIIAISISANAQQPKDKITKEDLKLKLKKRVVTWVCSVEDLSTRRLKIKAFVVAEPGKNEVITVTSNLDLERIAFYSYKGVGGFTAGVEGSGELFKTYSIDFSGVNGGEKEKSCKLLCYFKGSKTPDATIIVTPLITYK